MAKKEEHLPGLSALVRSGNTSYAIYPVAAQIPAAMTKQEQQMAAETQTHLQIMRNQRLKTDVAMNEMSQLHQHASDEFQGIANHLTELNEEARGKSHQAIVEEFNRYNAELSANHLFGALKVGAHSIAEQVSRPIQLPLKEEPAPRRGFLGRLRGD